MQDEAGNFKDLEYDKSNPLAPGLCSFAVAVSPLYYAAAFLDENGQLNPSTSLTVGHIQIKVHGEKMLILRPRHAARFDPPSDTDPLSMSFASNSKRLVLLNYVWIILASG